MIEDIINKANKLLVYNSQLDLLKVEFSNKCIYYYNGGKFLINPGFLSFVSLFITRDTCVLIDVFELPILIENVKLFYDTCLSLYMEAVNDYFYSYSKLNKSRKVEGMLE